MAFRNWRIGMHIQQDHIAIVALLLERSRWALRRWWSIPLMPGTVRQGIVVDVESLARQLQPWRRELPLQHQACIAFPAARTLQKQLPRPQISLRESEQATWIASAMAQQLEMPASSLCVDYVDARAVGWLAGHRRAAPWILTSSASWQAALSSRWSELFRTPARLAPFSPGNLMTFRGWPGVTKRAGFGPPPIAGDAVRAATFPLFPAWFPG